ncbi:hypothetical protein Tco_0734341 [Tanacetum coccineum]
MSLNYMEGGDVLTATADGGGGGGERRRTAGDVVDGTSSLISFSGPIITLVTQQVITHVIEEIMLTEEDHESEDDSDDETNPSSERFHVTEEEVKAQKLEEDTIKAEPLETKRKKTKAELLLILGRQTVEEYYMKKIIYDSLRLRLRLLNKRAKGKITNMDINTRKGPLDVIIYKDDNNSESSLSLKFQIFMSHNGRK